MPSSRSTWCAALAAGCFFTAPLAEARLDGSSASTPDASESRGPRPHDAYRQHRDYPAHQGPPAEEASTQLVRLGVEAQSARQGRALSLRFGLEEERWGIATRLGALSLKAEDGSGGSDRLYLVDAHVTYAVAAGERGRLRIETGVAAVRAPDVTFVGPSLTLSFERCLLGALDLEGRLQWVPLPHLQVDGQIGLALHLGALSVRGGWRGLYLDDRGRVDRVVHTERIGGPFGGVGLSF